MKKKKASKAAKKSPSFKKSKVTSYALCMFCGGQNSHKDAEVCRIKSIAATALLQSIGAADAMFIMDRTSFLDELEKSFKAA